MWDPCGRPTCTLQPSLRRHSPPETCRVPHRLCLQARDKYTDKAVSAISFVDKQLQHGHRWNPPQTPCQQPAVRSASNERGCQSAVAPALVLGGRGGGGPMPPGARGGGGPIAPCGGRGGGGPIGCSCWGCCGSCCAPACAPCGDGACCCCGDWFCCSCCCCCCW